MIHWHILINKVGVSQPKATIVSQARSLMCKRASGLFAVFTDIPHLYLRLHVVENAADRLGLSCKIKSALDFRFYLIDLHNFIRKHICLIFSTPLNWNSVNIDFFWGSQSKIGWISMIIFLFFKLIVLGPIHTELLAFLQRYFSEDKIVEK